MAKSIRLLGATYPDVPEVDLPLSGGGTARFIERDETAFVVTLSWDSEFGEDGGWVPDKTFSEVQSAVLAGRQITAEGPTIDDNVTADCIWNPDQQCLYYMVYFIYDGDVIMWKQQVYSLSQNGIALAYEAYMAQPSGTIAITQAGNNNVSGYANASVPLAGWDTGALNAEFITQNSQRKWRINPNFEVFGAGWITSGVKQFGWSTYNAVASGTSVNPTESAQTIGGANTMMEGAVTVNAISSSYVGSGITRRSSSDLTANGLTVNAPSGYYQSAASKTLTDQNLIASNIKKDVSIFGVTGSYEGGGSTGLQIGTATSTPSSASQSISFTGLSGEPTSFYVVAGGDLSTAAQAKTAAVVFDGTSLHGQTVTNTSNAQASYVSTGWSKSYSSGTLTITGTSYWQAVEYTLVYTYGGSAANLGTDDVQVGSGATSISFTGLSEEPSCWSVIFKSNFGTSSGYQRVMAVVNDGNSIEGMAMGSGGVAESSWSASFSNGTLTVTSQSTNAGGYWHQPGYYQLTYAVGGTIEITTEPLSVTENGTYTAPSGKAYTPVTVNVSGGGGSMHVASTTWTNSSNTATSHQWTGLSGTPKFAVMRLTTSINRSSGSTNYFAVEIVWNGTSCVGHSFRRSNGTYANKTTGYSASVSGSSITFSTTGTSTTDPGSFYNGDYQLIYVY